MKKITVLLTSLLCLTFLLKLFAAENQDINAVEHPSKALKENVSETSGSITIDGKKVPYKATAGNIIIKDNQGNPKGSIFYIAYHKDDIQDLKQRPIAFCFNGGPSCASVWLHLGALGPKRVALTHEGKAIFPYHHEDNEFSLLDVADLVFVDPISTGYSCVAPGEDAKQFHGVDEDIQSLAQFIRLYTTRTGRWESPKFLIGESYGTLRAAGLAGLLHNDYRMSLNGVILISSILDYQTMYNVEVDNDLPNILYLPSYTAAAWYHKKLPSDLQKKSLAEAVKESEAFAIDEYSIALLKGASLDKQQREQTIQKLARYTGLSPLVIEKAQMRIDPFQYRKELLKEDNRTIGRFDIRFKGIDSDACAKYAEYDSSLEELTGIFTAVFNDYARNQLNWKTDEEYRTLVSIRNWNYKAANRYLNVAPTLAEVMAKNPNFRVFVASGYYDLALPYFTSDYSFNHLGYDGSLLKRVTKKYYEAGHMMFIYRPALIQLKKDVAGFILEANNS